MGCCTSKPTPIPPTSTTSPKQRPLANRILHRRTTNIHNQSSTHAHFIITPSPITSVSSVSIDKLGSIALDQHGKHLAQSFKLVSGRSKQIKVDSHRFYVASFLHIDNEWKPLWPCREFSASDDIFILERHIEEANLPALMQEEEGGSD